MVRRRAALGAGLVLLLVIVLLVNGCLKSEKSNSLKEYNSKVSQVATSFTSQVSEPLFRTLAGAAGKSAVDVQEQVNQLRLAAQTLANEAAGFSVPGEMVGAQRDLLLALNLRVEGMVKLAALAPAALGGQDKQAATKVAGAMETFLASDVVYSQRVAPLIQQTLKEAGIQAATRTSRFLPNLGWLEGSKVSERLTGQSSSSGQSTVSSGTHGSALIGVAVGANNLAAEPELNHVSGGGNPTFTATVEDTGTNKETNVKVDVVVTAAGKELKASHSINQTTPGQKVNVEIPITGVPLGVASKVQVTVEAVPGETNLENNKATYLAIFGE